MRGIILFQAIIAASAGVIKPSRDSYIVCLIIVDDAMLIITEKGNTRCIRMIQLKGIHMADRSERSNQLRAVRINPLKPKLLMPNQYIHAKR